MLKIQAVRIGLVVAAIGVLTAIDFRLHANPTTVALTFLVAVLLVSAYWGLGLCGSLVRGGGSCLQLLLPSSDRNLQHRGSAKLGRALCFSDNRTRGQQSGGTRTP